MRDLPFRLDDTPNVIGCAQKLFTNMMWPFFFWVLNLVDLTATFSSDICGWFSQGNTHEYSMPRIEEEAWYHKGRQTAVVTRARREYSRDLEILVKQNTTKNLCSLKQLD